MQPEKIAELLKPVLASPARSQARANAVKAAAESAGVTERAIRNWAGKLERTRSAASLVRKQRSDKWDERVFVSQAYDRALLPYIGRAGLAAVKRDVIAQIRRVLNSPITSAKEIKQVHIDAWLVAYTMDLVVFA